MAQDKRRRRSSTEARALIVAAARRRLLEHGPQALTLQAVAADLGMAHSNLTHHFGTSASLQGAVAADIVDGAIPEIERAIGLLRSGEIGTEEIVDIVFGVFREGGLGRLIGWLSASGETGALDLLFATLAGLVEAARAGEPPETDPERLGIGVITRSLFATALGEALIGVALGRATGITDHTARRLAADRIATLVATRRDERNVDQKVETASDGSKTR